MISMLEAADSQILSPAEPFSDSVWHGTIAYDGTGYHGWQIQSEIATVQGELTRRLRLLFDNDELRLGGTSRTDAGVHALDQHFSFVDPSPGRFTPEELKYRLRRWLPEAIFLRDLVLENDDFHARHSARGKAYTYCVFTGPAPSPFSARYVWHCPRPVDRGNIRSAAACLVGTHDFTSLAGSTKEEVENPYKTLHRLDVLEDGQALYFNVMGDSFLYKMVRSIVGYLMLKAGRDPDWTPGKLQEMLGERCRDEDVQTAPAKGLFLAKVFFETDPWQKYVPILPPQSAVLN